MFQFRKSHLEQKLNDIAPPWEIIYEVSRPMTDCLEGAGSETARDAGGGSLPPYSADCRKYVMSAVLCTSKHFTLRVPLPHAESDLSILIEIVLWSLLP